MEEGKGLCLRVMVRSGTLETGEAVSVVEGEGSSKETLAPKC